MARWLVELNTGVGVGDRLVDVRAPCLVSCRIEEAWLSPDNSPHPVEQIPGARLLELPGVDRDRGVGTTDGILAGLEEFVSAIRRDPAPAGAARLAPTAVHSQRVAAGSCAHRATTWRCRCRR
jgi:hypothetical protein